MKKFRIILVMFIVILFFVIPKSYVFAVTSSTTSVMTDLESDPNFNAEDYPTILDDYSLQVIQIAETIKNELIIYVYQPSNAIIDLVGTKISMSYGYSKNGKDLEPKLYPIELLSTDGVFDKYIVNNFDIPVTDTHRYYNIVSIFRNYNDLIDEENDDFGDFTDMAFSVGQQWHSYYLNDYLTYEMLAFKTLDISTIIVESLKFENGFDVGSIFSAFKQGHAWFIGFNCEDYVIKHIYDADMSYSIQRVSHVFGKDFPDRAPTYYEKEVKTLTLTDIDNMSWQGSGLFGDNVSWNRIQSSNEFLSSLNSNGVSIDDSVRESLSNSQWVFSFAETELTSSYYAGNFSNYYYEISEVGILRLHFYDITGKVYDLGVVNSLVDPDNIPGGSTNQFLSNIQEFIEKIFAILGLIVLVVILIFCSSIILPVINIISFIFKAISYVISLPFKIIKWVFKK